MKTESNNLWDQSAERLLKGGNFKFSRVAFTQPMSNRVSKCRHYLHGKKKLKFNAPYET